MAGHRAIYFSQWERASKRSHTAPAPIPTVTHLQAGHPDAHGPHEQQVVSQELLQLRDAAALQCSQGLNEPRPSRGEERGGRAAVTLCPAEAEGGQR